MDFFFQLKNTQNQIYNDDFAGLKTYWVEEFYEEIVFKLDEQMNLIFSKMRDIPRNYIEYCVFMEPKNASIDIKKYDSIVKKIISEKSSSCSTV